MKKYQLSFFNRNTDKKVRKYVMANSVSEAHEMGLNMSEAKIYEELITGEFKEGLCVYCVAFKVLEYGGRVGEDNIGVWATSPQSARNWYNRNIKGKYYSRYHIEEASNEKRYTNDIQALNCFDVYQWGNHHALDAFPHAEE